MASYHNFSIVYMQLDVIYHDKISRLISNHRCNQIIRHEKAGLENKNFLKSFLFWLTSTDRASNVIESKQSNVNLTNFYEFWGSASQNNVKNQLLIRPFLIGYNESWDFIVEEQFCLHQPINVGLSYLIHSG